MTSVRWSREAQTDVASIDEHYHEHNPGYAARVARQAVKAARFLADNPDAGPFIGNRTRKWRVAGTPHLLFYRLDGKILRVVRVMHGARDWQSVVD